MSESEIYNKNQKHADQQSVKSAMEFLQSDYMLPYLADVERQTLGIVLNETTLRLQAMALLRSDDFYIPAYRHTFEAVVSLVEKNEVITALSVGEILRKKGFLKDIGGVAGISTIQSEIGLMFFSQEFSRILKSNAKKLRDKTVARKVFKVCRAVAENCFLDELDAESLLASAESELTSVRQKATLVSTLKTYKEAAEDTRTELQKWKQGIETSLDTGIPEFNQRLWARGLAKTELYYFAALSSFGKTALVWQMLNSFEMQKKRGIFFTLEMTAVKLLLRALQRMSNGLEFSPFTVKEIKNAESEKAQRRALENQQTFETAMKLLEKIENWQGLLDEKTRDWKQMKARIKQAHAEKPLDYIAGDYIQMVQNELDKERRDLEIAAISRESKELAEELNVPFIWISQLNRTAKHGDRPEFDSLKESSYLEQDADFIGFLYGKKDERKEITRKLNFYCPKQRNGRAGWEIPIDFETDKQLFVTEQLLAFMETNEETNSFNFSQSSLKEELQRQKETETTTEIESDDPLDFSF